MEKQKQYDVFISHASEDKIPHVENLVKELRNEGIRVWYDDTELEWGEGVFRSIQAGLSSSHFGIIILSPFF